MSEIKIATAPCSWGVWYPDGTPSGTPWEVFLDQAAESGYKALELGPVGYLPTDNDVLRKELEARGLEVCAGTCVYKFDQMSSFEDKKAEVDELCRRLKDFGAKYLVVMDESDVGEYSEKKKDITEEKWAEYLKMMRDMGEFTKNEYGISTVYHPHIRSLIETEDEIERLLDETGLDLCFDTGHHAYVNGGVEFGDKSALDFLKKHASRIPYLHFKNVSGDVRKRVKDENLTSSQAFDMDVMCWLDKGVIDFAELKKVLDEIGYKGVGVIEMDAPRSTTQQAYDAAKNNLEYLKELNYID